MRLLIFLLPFRHQVDPAAAMPPKKDAADGKTKKAKKIKDPNAPKRPMTAYFLFMAEKRAEVLKNNPDFKIGDVAKVCLMNNFLNCCWFSLKF